jgi:hypothetical protein
VSLNKITPKFSILSYVLNKMWTHIAILNDVIIKESKSFGNLFYDVVYRYPSS